MHKLPDHRPAATRTPAGAKSSIESGDVVLCSLPPYSTQPWLSMGVVLHFGMLAEAGIRARVVRPIAPPFDVPDGVLQASLTTFVFDPAVEERMAAMEAAYAASPAFFDDIVDELVRGGEQIIALSVYRNNIDFSLLIAKLVKARRPKGYVVIGGPEAVEDPPASCLDWVDAVVGADAESVFVPLVAALLSGRTEAASVLRNVWINPRVRSGRGLVSLQPAPVPPAYPRIDYAALVPLLVGDAEATMPVLLNWGCPYQCAFCSNRSIYSRFTAGSVERVLSEMDEITHAWHALRGEHPEGLTLQLSDATTNALPAQFDALLTGVASRKANWLTQPSLRGQTLFDSRITRERVRLMAAAGFSSTFFGLESASDRLRRSLQKPASTMQVAAAIEEYHHGGAGGLHIGVPVGIPGEEDQDFVETLRFMEWAVGLKGTVASVTVLPYVFFLSAQDPGLADGNRGARRGVMWRNDGPGGDPATRARRFMQAFEAIDLRVPTNSPLPPYLFLPAMLPEEPAASLERWMDRYGHTFDQISPAQTRLLSGSQPKTLAQPLLLARAALTTTAPPPGFVLEGVAESTGSPVGLVALFRGEAGARVALALDLPVAGRRAYASAGDLDLSYLNSWQGFPCSFDKQLIDWCATILRAPPSAAR